MYKTKYQVLGTCTIVPGIIQGTWYSQVPGTVFSYNTRYLTGYRYLGTKTKYQIPGTDGIVPGMISYQVPDNKVPGMPCTSYQVHGNVPGIFRKKYQAPGIHIVPSTIVPGTLPGTWYNHVPAGTSCIAKKLYRIKVRYTARKHNNFSKMGFYPISLWLILFFI